MALPNQNQCSTFNSFYLTIQNFNAQVMGRSMVNDGDGHLFESTLSCLEMFVPMLSVPMIPLKIILELSLNSLNIRKTAVALVQINISSLFKKML